MNLTFDPEKHEYRINSQIVPGVTSITACLPKSWLAAWAAKEAIEYIKTLPRHSLLPGYFISDKELDNAKNAWRTKRDMAASKGTDSHYLFQLYVESKLENKTLILPETVDKEVLNSYGLFVQWEQATKPTWIASEQIVGSERVMVGGKFDAIADIDGIPTLIDFKTSNGIYEEYYIQLAGYQMLYEEVPGRAVLQRMILHTPKTGSKFTAKIVPTDYQKDKEAFLAALVIYKWLQQFKDKHGTK